AGKRAGSSGCCVVEDLHDAEGRGHAQRPGRHQPDPIPNRTLVLVIVRLQPCHPPQHLPVAMMTDESLHHHDHGLLHLVAHHFADTLTAVSLVEAVLLAHAAPLEAWAASPSTFSRRMVFTRAISRLVCLILVGFSTRPATN